MGSIYKAIFGISEAETGFARRGFRGGEGGVREVLEKVGHAFVFGYHVALEDSREAILVKRLAQIDHDYCGFAYEGAAMGLGLLDRLTPWNRNRVENFLKGPGEPHTYMVHVALGWVVARLPRPLSNHLLDQFSPHHASRITHQTPLDPLLRWLILDGYGFHEGFFHWPKYIEGAPAPARLHGYARRVFDQGFGRSLWFVDGGDGERISRTISGFGSERHADLWSGIGLASVYAGTVSDQALRALRETAGEHWPSLGQGAAFAAKARHRAGNVTAYTERASRILCNRSAAEAARLTDEALENLPGNGPEPAYEVWRQRIQQALRSRKEIAK